LGGFMIKAQFADPGLRKPQLARTDNLDGLSLFA
jgi:hypothetical protein